MTVKGKCPTPRKGKFDDKLLAETIMIHMKYNRGLDVEIYECGDHWHVRDKMKRRQKEKAREVRLKERRRQYRQLTIFDWMNELDGTQGV